MRLAPTTSELVLWQAIRGRRLGVQFRRQVPLGGRYIADFFVSELGLIVEWYGSQCTPR
jgi:cyclase